MDTTQFVKSLTEDKVDPKLGAEIQKLLGVLGYENPINNAYRPDAAYEHIETGVADALFKLGFDMDDPSMRETPKRYACMFIGELTKGLDYNGFPKCTTTPAGNMDQMVIVKDIQVMSLCEHHLQTIDGQCTIAYLPKYKLLGLSKFARIVEFFSRRPQVQERLTEQVYATLSRVLGTEDVAVSMTAVHYCMKARGALQHAAVTTTNKFGGRFLSQGPAREEFFACIS